MKRYIVAIVVIVAAPSFLFAHDSVTIGPNGGRVIYQDSPEIPNVEMLVNSSGQAEVYVLDKDRKTLPLDSITIQVTAGPRSSAKKLEGQKHGTKFVTVSVPEGAPYFIVAQVKSPAAEKPIIARLNYDPKPAESGKPAYLDDSVNAHSGDNIAVPGTAAGIWAELNQHQKELTEGIEEKKYEAIDEVSRAYPQLAKGLTAQSGDRAAAVAPLVETLATHLAAVSGANAARTLDAAKPGLDGVAATLAKLKELYPAEVANAKLAE